MGLIVMTGATSGIGRVAAEHLADGGARIIAGVRSNGLPAGVEGRSLDLASLSSVRDFAEGLPQSVDALVLNAGMQMQSIAQRSADGYELTFAANHLAHYLLARLALPRIAEGGRIVFTSSGTHDPREKTGIPAPRHADARRLADPASDTQAAKSATAAGMRAYSTSKLCNLMTARTMAALPEVRARNIAVHAYDPGFIPATGLARTAPSVVRGLILPILARFPVLKGMNSLADGGAALAGLADGSIDGPRVYMSLRKGRPTWPDPSDLARDDAKCAALWRDSAGLVGLPV
jgi:NAD(P)-dependent dehydrogenase (short-subunit alcohol dehydrogenase family)